MTSAPPRILCGGEAAISVEFGNAIDPALNARVRALDEAIRRNPIAGLIETVPTYRSLLVLYDPIEVSPQDMGTQLVELCARISEYRPAPTPVKEVPSVYDGEDLGWVERYCGLTRRDIVGLHSGAECMVYMLGFTPGFAYMGLLPEAMATPRRPTPRTWVPNGAIAIAGRQTAVYPCASPSGWHLIGRACLSLFDPSTDPPTFFVPGDRVRFYPVDDVGEPPVYRAEPPNPSGQATFEVVKRKAAQTTVQDLGRFGYRRYGVPMAGALDAPSLRAANLLVGNPPGSAALECTIAGPVLLRLLRTTVIAITGADLGAVIERKGLVRIPVPNWSSVIVQEGDLLRFTQRRAGARAYLAVAGGIDVPRVLGSRSTYLTSSLGGYQGRALRPDDVLHALPPKKEVPPGRRWPDDRIPRYDKKATLRVVFGPQDDYFTEKARELLLAAEYVISISSDRMGCRLEGPRLEHRGAKEIVSDGMMLGAVQVPPDGRPIVMLADHATAGGYPKIATVVGADIPKIAQLMPGETVCFRAVEFGEARHAFRKLRFDENEVAREIQSRV